MIKLQEKIIQAMLEVDPTLDLSPGSNLRDLVVNPLSTLFQGYEQEVEQIRDSINLANPASLPEATLDSIAANYLVTRNRGRQATGSVYFYFRSAQTIQIPAGTILDRNGVRYQTTAPVVVSRLGLTEVSGQFRTPQIPIMASVPGPEGTLRLGDQLRLETATSFTPSKIEVAATFTSGEQRETNIQLYERIKSSVYNNSLASSKAISSKLKSDFPEISHLQVVGAGDPLMIRDLTPSVTGFMAQETFAFVNSGQLADPYARGHSAYIDTFAITVLEDEVFTFPDPWEWVNEFTNDMYKSLSRLDNGPVAVNDPYAVLDLLNIPADRLITEIFTLADSFTKDNELIRPKEISYIDGDFILGYIPDPQNPKADDTFAVDLKKVEAWVDDILSSPQTKKEFGEARTRLKLRFANEVNNYSPVMHRQISQHTGIIIDVDMSTTDATEFGNMAYVTVLRNSEFGVAHDGYGLAWRKQPGYLIRLDENLYPATAAGTAARLADYATFEEEFGQTVPPGFLGNASDPSFSDFWKYNVYLVDNDILSDKTYIGRNSIADLIGGRNQFIQMGKAWIVPEQTYHFRVQIYPSLATKIWVRNSSDESSVFTEDHLVVDRGSTYPNFLPASGAKVTDPVTGLQTLDITKGHFGIGVLETKGYQWTASNILIRSFVTVFPMQLYNIAIDTEQWADGAHPFDIVWYGYGYDPEFPEEGAAEVRVWNPGDQLWELVGQNSADVEDALEDKKITKRFYNVEDYIHEVGGRQVITYAATAKNFGEGFEESRQHFLATHFTAIQNPYTLAQHRYNAVDVWCYSPEEIVEVTIDGTVDNITKKLVLELPYMQDLVEVRDTISGVTIPQADYSLYNPNPGETGGANHELELFFYGPEYAGASVTALCRVWSGGAGVQTYLENPDTRYPAMTIAAKTYPPCRVVVNQLNYSGQVDEEVVREAVRLYVNGITDGKLEKSDLVRVVSDSGATFIDLDMEVSVVEYDSYFTRRERAMAGQRLTLDSNRLTKFFTTHDDLIGITRV